MSPGVPGPGEAPAAPPPTEAPEKKEKKEKPKTSAEEQNKQDLERSKKEIESLEQGLKKSVERLAAGKAVENDPKERQKIYEEEHKPQYERERQNIQQLLAPAEAKFRAAQERLAAFMKTVPPNTPKATLDAHPQYQELKKQFDECKENRDKVAAALVNVNARETEEKRGLRSPPKSDMEGHSRDMQDAMDDMKNTKNPMEAIAHLLRAFTAFMALLKGEKHPGVQQGRDALAAQGRRNTLKTEVAATTPAGGKNNVDTLITNKQTALEAPTGPKKRLAGLEEAKVNLDANKTKKAQLEADEAKTPKPPEAPPPAPARAQQIATLTEMINKAANYETEKATLQKEVDAAETEIKDLTAMKEEAKTAVEAENATLGRLRAAKPEALKGLDGITAGVGPDGISVVLKVDAPKVGAVRIALGPPPLPVTVLDNNGVVLDKDAFKTALTAKLDANFNGLKATNKFQRTIAGLKSGKWTVVAGNADLAEGARLGATEVMNFRGNTLMKTPGGIQIMLLDGSVKRLADHMKIAENATKTFYDAVLLATNGEVGKKIESKDVPSAAALAAGPDKLPEGVTQYGFDSATLTLRAFGTHNGHPRAYGHNPTGTPRWAIIG